MKDLQKAIAEIADLRNRLGEMELKIEVAEYAKREAVHDLSVRTAQRDSLEVEVGVLKELLDKVLDKLADR